MVNIVPTAPHRFFFFLYTLSRPLKKKKKKIIYYIFNFFLDKGHWGDVVSVEIMSRIIFAKKLEFFHFDRKITVFFLEWCAIFSVLLRYIDLYIFMG